MSDDPRAVLFACNLNRVRSPMAAALLQRRCGDRLQVDSCGLQPAEEIDGFAYAVMAEIGVDLADHLPKSFEALQAGAFDLLISLTPEAAAHAEACHRRPGLRLERWAVEDPSVEQGAREQRLQAYRRVRDDLDRRLAERFSAKVGRS